MYVFLQNVLLALAWAAITGQFTPTNLLLGFGISYLILMFAQRVMGSSSYFAKVRQVIGFAAYFAWEMVLANLRVARDVITHHYGAIRPGVIAVPLDAKTDTEITLLANLITLTPGTLSLDISLDRRVLYIHAIDIHDPEALRRDIKNGLERRLLEVLR